MDEEDSPAELAERVMRADRPSTPSEKRLRFQWNVPEGVTPYVPFWFAIGFVLLMVFVVVVSLTG